MAPCDDKIARMKRDAMSEIFKLPGGKLRYILAALGMVIGMASIIIVVKIGMTGKQFVLDTMQKFGTN
jgi:hypothetical protein